MVSVCSHTSNILVPQKLSLQDIRITILGARTTFLNSGKISSPILSWKYKHRLILLNHVHPLLVLSYLWRTKELITLFCFKLNCGAIITKTYRITNAFYHKITVIILPPMRSNSEWVAESCNLSNLSLSPQSLAHTPGSIRVVEVIF